MSKLDEIKHQVLRRGSVFDGDGGHTGVVMREDHFDWLIAEVERLTEALKEADSHAMTAEAVLWNTRDEEIANAIHAERAKVAKLRPLLLDCMNDMRAELEAKYTPGIRAYPSEERRYQNENGFLIEVARVLAETEDKP